MSFLEHLEDFRKRLIYSCVALGIGMALSDPVTFRYTRVNPRFCEITGYPAAELLTMTFAEIAFEYRDESGRTVAESRSTVIETSQRPTKE